MKIATLTFLETLNYGAVLQAYALQKKLNDDGYDTEVLRLWLSPDNHALYGFFQNKSVSYIRRGYHLAKHIIKHDYIYSDFLRRVRTASFIKQYIKTSAQEYKSLDQLNDLKGYSCLIVGSDQVWNPWKGVPSGYILNDVKSIPKISYAPSFGVPVLPENVKECYRLALEDFKALSCREKSGTMIIENLLGKNAKWVVDPVLLLPREDWYRLVQRKKSGYVFCYWLGSVTKLNSLINDAYLNDEIHLCLNAATWAELFSGEFKKKVSAFPKNVKLCLNNGPLEFLNQVANADEIITDSFHLMMFSVIFEKACKIYINSSEERLAMQDRMLEFAEKVGMTECVYMDISDGREKSVIPNYSHVKFIINRWRQESLDYLADALKNLCM